MYMYTLTFCIDMVYINFGSVYTYYSILWLILHAEMCVHGTMQVIIETWVLRRDWMIFKERLES